VGYLFIAHDLAAVAHLSQQIAVMYLGKLVEVSESLELCAKPLHPYTKALFAASLPSHPDEPREEIVLSGEVRSALNPPRGGLPPLLVSQGSDPSILVSLGWRIDAACTIAFMRPL
jgi:ABC-type oligopeptide transport system ATPase subunit